MRRVVHKLFWIWQLEKEQAWVNEMASHGYALEHAGRLRFEFDETEPDKYIYKEIFLKGWGESADEVGAEAHHTSEAHVMQAYNGLRILNLLLSNKDIDQERVGVNGGSGGGTQTVLLSVLDKRFTASCPVVSMSSWFDGGCPCESGMPIHLSGGGTCNAELAAMFAPKPMMVVSDGGDWTSTTPEVEFPYLQRIYGFYGKQHLVSNVHLPDEGHDFGVNKRQAVYDFFVSVFGLDSSKQDETLVTIEKEQTLRMSPKKQ